MDVASNGDTSDLAGQREVIAFLSDPATHGAAGPVKRVDTHGAMVFLAGDSAVKIKRAVRYAYMDFSTLEKRRAACEREIELNRAAAPRIYIDAVAITRDGRGALAFGGDGEPVEWCVRMHRFDETASLDKLAEREEFPSRIVRELGRQVARLHEQAPVRDAPDQRRELARTIAENAADFAAHPEIFAPQEAERLSGQSQGWLERRGDLLAARQRQGHVRRCHGDLHLGNIVMIEGRPVVFDAIEFDEAIASIDVLYDLAFLIMDLVWRGLGEDANAAFNAYLGAGGHRHLEGLRALPLFLSLRAAIRAKVIAARLAHEADDLRAQDAAAARRYFKAAQSFLDPAPPRLIAVGGLSGSGKTTVARAIAPLIGPLPGAVHLRSDVERKQLAGVAETERLTPEAYTNEATEQVYARLSTLARTATAAGHSAIVDAVHARPHERETLARLSADLDVRFTGIWLEAPADIMIGRVRGRTGDASDATAEVVQAQLDYETGEIDWIRVAAGGGVAATVTAVRRALGR